MKIVSKFLLIFIILVCGVFYEKFVSAFSKVTNIECESFNKKFAEFKMCRLFVPRRREISVTVHVNLYELPVNNISINLSLWRKTNTYQPFLYNKSTDFCQFMKNKVRKPFLKIVFDTLLENSNVNHTCPYDHDIIVKNFVLNDEMFRLIPLPVGQYMIKLMVAAYNQWKAEVRFQMLVDL